MFTKIIMSLLFSFVCFSLECMNLEHASEVFDCSNDDYFIYEAFLNDEALIIATQCKRTQFVLCTFSQQTEDSNVRSWELDGSWFATLQNEHRKSQNINNN